MPQRRPLVVGLPGAGKTTLSRVLARRLNAVHFNANEMRENINRNLSFRIDDRIEQARRMGWLCRTAAELTPNMHAISATKLRELMGL